MVVQIKYGPIDFQVREPPSPLFSSLHNTNTAIELQVTQEYLGQQDHLVYLAPLWKEILDFDLRADDRPSQVKDIISGKRFNRPLGGFAAVVNVGTNKTWLGSHLAMSVRMSIPRRLTKISCANMSRAGNTFQALHPCIAFSLIS